MKAVSKKTIKTKDFESDRLKNCWLGFPSVRVAAGVIAAGAFLPIIFALFGTEKEPLWERWLAVAVFTPIGLIGEWIVFTGRTKIWK